MNGIKTQYIQAFYTDIILNIDKKTFTVKSGLDVSEKKILKEQADYVGSIAQVCGQMSAWENMVAALSQQYELLHFIEDFEQADLIVKKMEEIILDNDWYGLEEKLIKLKNNGTRHEIFAEMAINSLKKTDERNKELNRLSDEINQMDMEDSQRPYSITGESVQINVFPFGNFYFEKAILDRVFALLNVTVAAKDGILNVMELGALPIVNAYRDPIEYEGLDGGRPADRGPASLVRIHRIRKALRDAGVFKVYRQNGY